MPTPRDKLAREIKFEAINATVLHRFYLQNLEPVDAVPTMLPSWNCRCRDEGGGEGLALGWHVIVAGKSGAGKSLFGLNLAVQAIKAGRNVGYMSLEMSERQLVGRALSILSETSIDKLEPGRGFDQDKYQDAAQRWEDTVADRLFVNMNQMHSLDDVREAMWVLHDNHDCTYFVTDYLQLAWASGADTLFDRVTEVSHTVRQMAQDLKVVSVGLSQFNRGTSASKDAPEETGLMGGSPLENDSDQVVLLDHSTYEKCGESAATQEIRVAKNRHGPQARIRIAWDYKTLRVTELDTEHDDRLPF